MKKFLVNSMRPRSHVQLVVASIALSTAALGTSSFAAGDRQQTTSPVRAACQADVQRLCPDVTPGNGALRQCMRSHASELSDACRQALAQAKQAKGQRGGAQ